MKIVVANTQGAFLKGGAEIHADGLVRALQEAGHQTALVTMPFRYEPPLDALRTMAMWANEDFSRMDGGAPDLVIPLKFPCYAVQHPNKVLWLLHQHRLVYDLWETPASDGLRDTPEGDAFRQSVHQFDATYFAQARKIFTNADNTRNRLWQYNQIAAETLYHPPHHSDKFYCASAEPYIFVPSRLEALKRQDLLIDAMALVKSPMLALIAGDGGTSDALRSQIERLDLGHKVRLLGRISDDEMRAFYAHSSAVFFGPKDEDYGYITLEAMLSAKPVITCTDSGGPLEFVISGETGYIVEPKPSAIADVIDSLYAKPNQALAMGQSGRAHYHAKNISWAQVVHALTS